MVCQQAINMDKNLCIILYNAITFANNLISTQSSTRCQFFMIVIDDVITNVCQIAVKRKISVKCAVINEILIIDFGIPTGAYYVNIYLDRNIL